MNIIYNIDEIIPFIGKTLWTHFDNPMTVWFYKIHQNNFLYGKNVLDGNYLCAIIEGDWKLLESKYWINRWKEYHITELNQ